MPTQMFTCPLPREPRPASFWRAAGFAVPEQVPDNALGAVHGSRPEIVFTTYVPGPSQQRRAD